MSDAESTMQSISKPKMKSRKSAEHQRAEKKRDRKIHYSWETPGEVAGLIAAVQKRPALWDASCAEYKATHLKQSSWQQVVDELGIKEVDANEAKQKWNSVRSLFKANLLKWRARKFTRGPDEEQTMKWPYFAEMMFLESAEAHQSAATSTPLMQMINNLRKANKISVIGKNIPAPISTFEELERDYNVSSKLVNNLASCKYPTPTPIQMQAIPIMLKGRALMACAPTGSGKTIAFLTPIINDLKVPKKDGFRALILAPTRELSQQIYRECMRLSEKTALKIHVISKVNQAEQKFGPKSNKKYDILISTPNRVRFLLQQEPPVLDLKSVEWFVIDEADKMLEEGQNSFKEQFDDILAACTSKTKKLALFSATYTVPVAKWALKHLKGLARVTIGQQNTATELVNQELLFVGSESGKLIAVRDLVRTGLKPPVLVFVQSKDRAKQLFDELLYDGINVDVIHADRTQQQRDNVVRAFREGHIWVLICTELMGRGIDFKGVNLVINYDFPPTTISYIHRIGRTGRAGRPGRAITFFTQNDTTNLRSIAQIIKNSGGTVPDYMLKLKKPKKSDKKQLANNAPRRDVISTDPKFEERRKRKLAKLGAFVKRRPSTDDETTTAPQKGHNKNKNKTTKNLLNESVSPNKFNKNKQKKNKNKMQN